MRLLSLLAVPLLLTACPGSDGDDPPEPAKEGTLVVGVQTTADITALVGSVHVVAKVDDVVQKDEVIQIAQLPKEIELKGKPTSKAEGDCRAVIRTSSVQRRLTFGFVRRNWTL